MCKSYYDGLLFSCVLPSPSIRDQTSVSFETFSLNFTEFYWLILSIIFNCIKHTTRCLKFFFYITLVNGIISTCSKIHKKCIVI